MKKTFLFLILMAQAVFVSAAPIVYQAEDGALNGTVANNAVPGYQGTGYVEGFDTPGDSCAVTVNAPASGLYDITMGYRSNFGEKFNSLYLNGSFYSSVTFTMTTSFSALDAGIVYLNAGSNVLSLVNDWGWIQFDWIAIEIVPATAQRISDQDLIPASVSTGQKDVYGAVFTLKNPSGGVALVKGVTITVKDGQSNLLDAGMALSAFGIRDESGFFFETTSVPASPYIYCYIPSGIQVPAYSEKNLYAVMDITDNTVTRAAEFKIDLDSNLNIRAEDMSTGNTLMVTAETGYGFPMGSSVAYIQNRATELSVTHLNSMPASVSTGQEDIRAMNLVLSDVGNTTTAGIKISRISFLIEDASGNCIPAQNAVSRLRITGSDGSFVYGEATAGVSGKMTVVLAAPLIVPSTQAFTCTVMVDATGTLSAPAFRVSLDKQGDIYAVDANTSEPVLVTSATSFPKQSSAAAIQEKVTAIGADNYTALLPSGVVKGQKWVELFTFRLSDALSLQSAAAHFESVTLTVLNASDLPAPASGAVEKFYITDASANTLGSVAPGVQSAVILPLTSPYVLNPGTSAYFRVFADISPVAYLSDFKAGIESDSHILVTDSNSGYAAAINDSPAVPWRTAGAGVFNAPATDLHVWHNGNVAPTLAGLGQPDVKFMEFNAANPGFTGTADAEIKGLTLTVIDAYNNVVAPASVLKSVQVTNIAGDITYAYYPTALETAAAPFYFPFSRFISVDALNTKNAYFSGDISMTATQGTYRLRLAGQGSIDRAGVPSGYITVTAVNSDTFPMDSNSVTVTALAYNFKAGHKNLMPVSVARGTAGVRALEINFQNYNAVPIAVTSVSFSIKSCDGTGIAADKVISSIKLYDRDNNLLGSAQPGAAPKAGVAAAGFTVAPGSERALYAVLDIKDTARTAFYIELETASDVATAPLSSVNPAEGDFFGNMRSVCVSIQDRSLEQSFHVFPSPFNPAKETAKVEYFLESNSVVSISVFTMEGRPVRKLADNVPKAAGLHYEDEWDGRNESGQKVITGIYLCVITVKDSPTGSSRRLLYKMAVSR